MGRVGVAEGLSAQDGKGAATVGAKTENGEIGIEGCGALDDYGKLHVRPAW